MTRILLILLPIFLAAFVHAEEFDFAKTLAAAGKGDAEAQFMTGRAHANGEGAPLDLAKAAGFYRKAAEQGNAKAQNNLAWFYIEGKGVTKNAIEGLRWLRKAAEQGTAKTQDNLGYILV